MATHNGKFTAGSRPPALLAAALATALSATALLAAAPSALAVGAPPIVTGTSLSEATTTTATLKATLNPNLKETTYSFQYIAEADWQADGEAFGEGTEATAQGEVKEGLGEAHEVTATIEGLTPGALYRARLFAHNVKGDGEGETIRFGTYPEASPGLPDGRAYEQTSPIGKNGGDVGGIQSFVKASSDGEGAIFGSTSGVPGGEGSQELPFYAASRSPGGWLSAGLQPPAALAQRAEILGWAPDFSRFFQNATLFGEPNTTALYERSAGGEETQIAPYLPGASYNYAGSSADEATAVIESSSGQLDESHPGAEGKSNVYAWDGSQLHLASVMNDGEPAAKGAFAGPYDWAGERTNQGGAASKYYTQEQRAVSADGSLFFTTSIEGHLYQRRNPTQEQSAMAGESCTEEAKACTLDVSPSRRTPPDPAGVRPRAFMGASADGSTAFFTSPEELTNDANTGPEVPGPVIGSAKIGSPPEEEPEDELPEVLAGHHAVGIATQGEYVYWADPSKGTIGRARLDGTEADDEYVKPGETCAETHPETEPGVEHCAPTAPRYVATGPCTDVGQCIYWTNTGPLGGDRNNQQEHRTVLDAGTIGRAKLGTEEGEEVKPEFITGASDPQGIAVNETHIYWANSQNIQGVSGSEVDIARAVIDGSAVEQRFHEGGTLNTLFGVALSATRVYWTMEEIAGFGTVNSIPLEGGSSEKVVVDINSGPKPRGITVIGPHVYWAAQGRGTIGRVGLTLQEPSAPGQKCGEVATCESEYLKPEGALAGLSADPSEEHLYWSANGEIPPHPGNDLYRFQDEGTGGCATPGGCLIDLTADSTDENGAEVKGVVGVSEDGTRLYFAANGVLAHNVVEGGAGPEEAQAGNCGGFGGFGHGHCNLYAWEAGGGPAGAVSFIAPLDAGGDKDASDFVDWVPAFSTARVTGLQKISQPSPDGQSLLFRSQEQLTAYRSEGTPELYLYRVGQGIACVSCNPTMAPPGGEPGVGRVNPFQLRAEDPAAAPSRFLSASGGRAFFETTDALSPIDTNGADTNGDGKADCPEVGGHLQGGYYSCLDVYEWEAPGEGSCKEGAPGYSPADEGCLYLISTGKGEGYPALFADASASGSDVFFFDREGLVGQDTDHLADLYDARVGGGIAAQNPPPGPVPCEGEACKPALTPPPSQPAPTTPAFQGPGNPRPPKGCRQGRVKRHGRCVPRHTRHNRKHRHNRRRAR